MSQTANEAAPEPAGPRCAGTQFDPAVVAAFLAMLDSPAAADFNAEDDAPFGLLAGFAEMTLPPPA